MCHVVLFFILFLFPDLKQGDDSGTHSSEQWFAPVCAKMIDAIARARKNWSAAGRISSGNGGEKCNLIDINDWLHWNWKAFLSGSPTPKPQHDFYSNFLLRGQMASIRASLWNHDNRAWIKPICCVRVIVLSVGFLLLELFFSSSFSSSSHVKSNTLWTNDR